MRAPPVAASTRNRIQRYEVTSDEYQAISGLLAGFRGQHASPGAEATVRATALLAQELPLGIRRFMCSARAGEDAHAQVVAVGEWIMDGTPPTPVDWQTQPSLGDGSPHEYLLLCLAWLLGEPFAWDTQQDGRVIQNVIPARGLERTQLAANSSVALNWHVDDAFHPHRADYVGLVCIRNPASVPTTLVSVDAIQVDPAVLPVLFEPRFIAFPDPSHHAEYNTAAPGAGERFERARALFDAPQPIALLLGDRSHPYLRVDPDFTTAVTGDAEAGEALDALCQSIDAARTKLVLSPGDFCFVDNYVAVHGRGAFTPRFDGGDRWLKKVYVTRNLRAARAAGRCSPCRRVM